MCGKLSESSQGAGFSTFKGKRLPNGKKNRHRPRVAAAEEDGTSSAVPDANNVTIEKVDKVKKEKVGKESFSLEKKSEKQEITSVPKKGKKDGATAEKKATNKRKVNVKDDPRLSRTIFIGNVPLGLRQQDISRLVSPYGKVESVRIRGVVPNAPGIPKKAALLSKRLHPGVNTQSCYVVFTEETSPESISKACTELNMTKLQECNIRVTKAADDEVCDRKTIYVGNLPYDVSEQVFLESFLKYTDDSSFEITGARLARDKFGAGRGFGFVSFDDELGARFAMGLQGKVDVAGRIARITKVDKQAAANYGNNSNNGRVKSGRISKRHGDNSGNHRSRGPKSNKFNSGDRSSNRTGNGFRQRSGPPRGRR